MNIFFYVYTFLSVHSVYALMVFELIQKIPLPYTIISLLFASLKLLTNFENSYWNPPQNSLLCDWSMLSSTDLSLALAAGKMCKNQPVPCGYRYDFTESQAASFKHFQCPNHALGSLKQVTGRIFKISNFNFKGASENFEFDFYEGTCEWWWWGCLTPPPPPAPSHTPSDQGRTARSP